MFTAVAKGTFCELLGSLSSWNRVRPTLDPLRDSWIIRFASCVLNSIIQTPVSSACITSFEEIQRICVQTVCVAVVELSSLPAAEH